MKRGKIANHKLTNFSDVENCMFFLQIDPDSLICTEVFVEIRRPVTFTEAAFKAEMSTYILNVFLSF